MVPVLLRCSIVLERLTDLAAKSVEDIFYFVFFSLLVSRRPVPSGASLIHSKLNYSVVARVLDLIGFEFCCRLGF